MRLMKKKTTVLTLTFLVAAIVLTFSILSNEDERRGMQNENLELSSQSPGSRVNYNEYENKIGNESDRIDQAKLLEAEEQISLLETEVLGLKDILEQPEIKGILDEKNAYKEHLQMEVKTDEERWQETKEYLDVQLDNYEPDRDRTELLEKQLQEKFPESQKFVSFNNIKCTTELCRVNMTFPNGQDDVQLAMNYLYSIEGLVGTVIFKVEGNAGPVRGSLYSIKESFQILPN